MKSIIVAYPNKKLALKLRDVLVRNGYDVPYVCALGASVLKIAHDMRGGVIVCADILSDIGANMLAESLPPNFDIIALSLNGTEYYRSNIVSLPLPLQMDEFLSTVSSLVATESNTPKRSAEHQEIISLAKSIVMKQDGISEMQAHKYLQRESMLRGKKLIELANEIIKQHE